MRESKSIITAGVKPILAACISGTLTSSMYMCIYYIRVYTTVPLD